tara:strand:- start:524 stop:730 length:207 start_codon:yes stop_codon:yes gene_type:complete
VKKRRIYPYEAVVIALTVVTNCFIIAGVTRHWIRYDYTKLAAPQQEAAQIQKETTHDTGCQSPYQSAN